MYNDRQLRYEITKCLKNRFQTKAQRKKAIRTDVKYKWIGKLYPAVFTDDYKIILMSVSKFMKRNSILIDPSYEFLKSDLIENAVIVIDEFDATKETIQSELVEKSLAMQEDYIQLFRQIYRTLNPNDFSSNMRRAMDEVEKLGNRYTFTTLMDAARKIAENYHVRLSIKTKEGLVDQRQIFLFNDGSFHTVLKEGAQYIRSSLNEEENRIDVFFEGKDDFFKNRNKEKDIVIYSLLREINVFLLHFRLFSIEWARNYMKIVNTSRSGIMDAMNMENAISSILKRLELTDRQRDLLMGETCHMIRSKSELILEDRSFYQVGMEYYEFEDSDSHHDNTNLKFVKGEVKEQQFKESIMKEYEDVKIQKIDLFDSEQCNKCFYYENRLLAQLLINSMRTPKHEAFMYNNLTGKLFYHDPSWRHKDKLTGKVNFIRFLEIVIDPGMYLNLEHKTFKRYDRESNGLYVIDSKTGEFRKKLKTDTNLITYKEGSLPHNHFRVDNFNITDYAHFRKSKMGVMEQFLRDVNDNLSKYITIDIVERKAAQEFDISNLEKKGISEREYGEMLQKKGVVIVDENNSEISKDIVGKLQEELEKFYSVKASLGNLSKDAYNIRIIHDGEYYAENEIHDPHSDNLKGYIVQHITEEAEHFTNTKGSSPDIKKIVQELIIKGDVRGRMISIFDWERLDSGKDWTFVIRKKIKTEFGENAAHINHLNKKALYYFNYYRLKIDCNGEMEFDTFCDSNQDETEEWSKICYTYDFVADKHRGAQNQVEGLMYSDIDNIHAILLTREKTLPNISALMNTLMETNAKERVSKELLLEAIDDFEKDNIDSRECISEWKSKVDAETEMITKKSLKKILNMRTGIASKFNRFLHEKYGVWIDGELRKEEFEATYKIGNLLNIKYEYDEKDYLDGRTFVYYVGAKTKRLAYPNACCMRKVISLGEELEYEEVLPLMAVEFVRNNQYTVLPFPFKYLREYIEQC